MRNVIATKHSKQNKSHEQFTKLDSYISYENNFRSFCQDIEELNFTVKEYWKSLLKEEKAIKTKTQFGTLILQKYKNFYDKYKQITKESGNFVNVVLLCWRLYRDTLSFELETSEAFELLQNLLSKKKIDNLMQMKGNSEGFMDEHIDSNLMIILISGNPKNMQQIININKQFVIFS